MDEMKEIEKNEETGTPSATPNEPVEEPPILPSIEDVVIGYQVKKPVETQAECDVYSVVVAAVTKHNETAVSGDYYQMIADLDDCYEVQQHEPVPSEDMKLESLKTSKISQSKIALSTFLSLHPIQWSDGKYYSVTSEKQALLTSNLSLYQISTAAGQPFKLTQNSTGDECVEWTYDDLAALALAIGVYVKPFVSHQQELEIGIKACATSAEVDAIEIGYDAVLAEYLDLHADKDVTE